jgi:putative hydrolase of the HAD superfamily
MFPEIEAIFMDVGNTLRIVVKDETFQAQARKQLMAIMGAQETEDAFIDKLDGRWKEYRKWAVENMVEASEKELWTHFLFPDEPVGKIAPLAGKLTRFWRDMDGRRVPRKDVKRVVVDLNRRGYTLGIIANMFPETEIPEWLEADGLTPYFKTVVLSSRYGRRKPDPRIFEEAVRQVGVDPVKSAYVGDHPERDVVGARKAGFGMTILLVDPGEFSRKTPTGECVPDRTIHEFSELLDLFPMRKGH